MLRWSRDLRHLPQNMFRFLILLHFWGCHWNLDSFVVSYLQSRNELTFAGFFPGQFHVHLQSVFLTCKNWSSIKSFQIKISRSSLLHIVVWSLWFCYISFFWMWGTWYFCSILSNKNAQIEKVTNITPEKHTLLDLFVAMGFDDRTYFRDEIEEHYFVTLNFLPYF